MLEGRSQRRRAAFFSRRRIRRCRTYPKSGHDLRHRASRPRQLCGVSDTSGASVRMSASDLVKRAGFRRCCGENRGRSRISPYFPNPQELVAEPGRRKEKGNGCSGSRGLRLRCVERCWKRSGGTSRHDRNGRLPEVDLERDVTQTSRGRGCNGLSCITIEGPGS